MKKNYVDRWKSDAFENSEIALKIYKDLKENLKYSPHPISGWRSIPDQNLSTVKINSSGLRNKPLDTLDIKKENCMLLGGSVAWGFGASSNENIASYQIEKKLSYHHKKYINVINFAEQMHSSHEELMTFIGYLEEINPKYIICLSGTNDINRGYKDLSKFTDLTTTWINYFNKGNSIGIVREDNLVKFLLKSILRFKKKFTKISNSNLTITKFLNKDNIPLSLYQKKIDIINLICESRKINVLHVLQPDLIFKKRKILSENDYYNFIENDRKEYFKKQIDIFKKFMEKKSKTESIFIKYFDLSDVFDDVDEPIYIDKAHFNDKGYEIISQKIADEMNKQFL